MRHSLQSEGFHLRLRPVEMEDAVFIVWLRNLESVRGRVGDSATVVGSQRKWLENYFTRTGDYYFIVETHGGIPLGTHGTYDVRAGSAESGRLITRPEIMGAGVPTLMLATDLAFEKLGLAELRSTCVSTNRAVHSLHRKLGYEQVGILRDAQTIDGRPVDLFQFLLTAQNWRNIRSRILPLAILAGKQIAEWERSQQPEDQPWKGRIEFAI